VRNQTYSFLFSFGGRSFEQTLLTGPDDEGEQTALFSGPTTTSSLAAAQGGGRAAGFFWVCVVH
jgi:hypothetical protein